MPYAIHSVNEDLAGNVYVLGIYRQGENYDGVVLKIEPSPLVADFDGDNLVDCADAGLLHLAITSGENLASFDLNGDQLVDQLDMGRFLARAADARGFDQPIVAGDADFNGLVNAADLNILASHWQSDNVNSWCEGDFYLDGTVNANDLNALAINWQSDIRPPATAASQPVPEPTALWLWTFGAAWITLCLRQSPPQPRVCFRRLKT